MTKKQLRGVCSSLLPYEKFGIINKQDAEKIKQFRKDLPQLKKKLKDLQLVASSLKEKGLTFASLDASPTRDITLADLEDRVTTLEDELESNDMDANTLKYLVLFITKDSSLFGSFAKRKAKAKVFPSFFSLFSFFSFRLVSCFFCYLPHIHRAANTFCRYRRNGPG